MSLTFDEFTRRAHDVLKADPGPQGREQVRALLEQILLTPSVAALVGDDQPNRRLLYHDQELGFEVLGHVYHEPKRTQPHDHGPTWAIYGQVTGTSYMDAWSIVEPATPEKPGKVSLAGTCNLTPGIAYLYNEGVLHAPRRDAPAKLIRIEGPGLDTGSRLKWEIVEA